MLLGGVKTCLKYYVEEKSTMTGGKKDKKAD